jgi:(S)-2-hydroxyglutarate dehydrogenase
VIHAADVRDVVVVGAGIVGLATAHRVLEARPGARVTVVEREPRVAAHQSSRNSGVVHAGLYYPPGSAKARWCRAGKAELERFCVEEGVPLERTGKLVIAVDRDELPALRELAARARRNGVEVEEVGPDGIRDHEPHAAGLAAVWSPETAVTDFAAVAEALRARIEDRGGEVRLDTTVDAIEEDPSGVGVTTSSGRLGAEAVVACAGAWADRVAAMTGEPPSARIVPIRGSWLELRPGLSHLVRGNIYPVPRPGLPFLGVHLTRRLDGRVWIGPNAVLAAARDGARRGTARWRDLADTLRFPGTWRLGVDHAGTAAGEVFRDRVLAAALREVVRYVPGITRADVRRGPWGVRAQAVRPDGTLVEDFEVHRSGRVLHLLNAPSPAATASLAIGGELARRVGSLVGDGT